MYCACFALYLRDLETHMGDQEIGHAVYFMIGAKLLGKFCFTTLWD